MSSLMGSPGLALAATAMAVSGTVILLALCRQHKPLVDAYSASSDCCGLRPCISSSEKRRRERTRKKSTKRVHFADEVAVELDRERKNRSEGARARKVEEACTCAGMPANRVALYNGILRHRLQQRVASAD
ncbi:uncharacterized protein LOC109710391 [Ananas comosus]|uniref:Uncharacterized protein LOC109710391 n=1 Tax=Ananas comosus TaxID=4615 RepID=A0A199V4Q8_ANACO|nr:uncharacterized protein LOC109710391 [Ananas comosus]OAY72039.1 hypothetical protein ACMD2_08918 [Ananas comosus]